MAKYVLTITKNNTGQIQINSDNNGFTVLELIGFMEAKRTELVEQLRSKSQYLSTGTAIVNNYINYFKNGSPITNIVANFWIAFKQQHGQRTQVRHGFVISVDLYTSLVTIRLTKGDKRQIRLDQIIGICEEKPHKTNRYPKVVDTFGNTIMQADMKWLR